MAQSYAPCAYVDTAGINCDIFFPVDDQKPFEKYCPAHRGGFGLASSENLMNTPANKQAYMDLHNEEVALCVNMTVPELDLVIANLEGEMAKLRARILARRSVRSTKLQSLTDAERAERRKIKLVHNAPDGEPTRKKTSMKKDPFQALVEQGLKNGMTEEKARAFAKEVLG